MHDNKDDYISVEKCDLVNYYGLSHGKQIILCVHRTNDINFLLHRLKIKRELEDNELSEEGLACREDLSQYPIQPSKYFLARADLFDITSNDIGMWEQLYQEGLFPYWKPKEGPFDFHNKRLGQVAFCRVEAADIPDLIVPLVEEGRANAKIRDMAVVNRLEKANWRPVLLPSEYESIREKVFKIMCKNISPTEAR